MTSRATTWQLFSDDAELLVEARQLAEELGLEVMVELDARPLVRAAEDGKGALAVALAKLPTPQELAEFAHASRERGDSRQGDIVLAVVNRGRTVDRTLELASDLGWIAVDEVEPLLAAMALSGCTTHPYRASSRALTALDRARMGDCFETGRGGGRLVRADGQRIGWTKKGDSPERVLGHPHAVGDALRAYRRQHAAIPPARAVIDGVDLRSVREVLIGPPRALSDPASKLALEPYGLPLPIEELCTSPSRAAAEAARIGFPVRISLASPDLRVWDHPDLTVDGVDNAARVRDIYRQMLTLATEREPQARLLGVHVTATTQAQALLRIVARPLPGNMVMAEIAFADPHGRAARDETWTVLPSSSEAMDRVVGRLAGADLLLEGGAAHRKVAMGHLSDALLRLAAFVDAHRDAIEAVELHPLALLIGGSVEVREACIRVGDAFLRSVQRGPR